MFEATAEANEPKAESQRPMQTMKAAILESAPGGLRIEDIPVPEPRAGEVLVKVSACGVCHTDLHVMKAEVAFPDAGRDGHEISGVVAALGLACRSGGRHAVASRVHHALRVLHAVRRGRDDSATASSR
jgi:S-(hydroxymethyl)glutathione dehydrogenase/alcohol dehydrogenase